MSVELLANAFPKLSQTEMSLLEPYATCEHFKSGEIIFKAGQADIDLFVVKSGALEILNPHDGDQVLVTHEPGNFSGDIDLLTRRPVMVNGRAKGATHLLRVTNSKLREVLHKIPQLSEILLSAFQLRRQMLEKAGKFGLKVLGYPHCRATTEVREFLHRNFVPFAFYDVLTENGRALQSQLGITDTFPAVECRDGTILLNPSLPQIARSAGIWRHCPSETVDLAIVGAGPAGITAAVYAASEGMSTLVIDKLGPGGQAGDSSKIENFIGFPSGLSGTELATRGILQMLKFGAQLIAPVTVSQITRKEDAQTVELPLDCGAVITAKVVLIAAGVQWKKLDATNAYKYERAGVYYACTSIEAMLHDYEDVAVVGAGNSAGQAAMFLAQCCPTRQVHMIVRSTIGSKMSNYLHTRILASKNIIVHEGSTITEVHGSSRINSLTIKSEQKGLFELPAVAVFVFIGAEPSHPWVPKEIARDHNGFLLTGADALNSSLWPLKSRQPYALETSMPRVLAAGDIRSGTTKRVGFAVGDGALAVTCVQNLLQLDIV